MRGARDCRRGMRHVALCALFGLITIRLDAQRLDVLAVGASRVSARIVDSVAASDSTERVTPGMDIASLLRAVPYAPSAASDFRRPDDRRKCDDVVPTIAKIAVGLLAGGAVLALLDGGDGPVSSARLREIEIPILILSVAAVGLAAVVCNQ